MCNKACHDQNPVLLEIILVLVCKKELRREETRGVEASTVAIVSNKESLTNQEEKR